MKKRLLSLLMALIMALSLVPVTAFAADDHDGQVHVTVENTTWTKADGALWEGTLVDEWVTLKDDSTMMSCIVDALAAKGYTQTGADTGYISEINGIKEKDASKDSGWMGTLNDWFTSEGFAKYTVANGKLKAGDEILKIDGYHILVRSDFETALSRSGSATHEVTVRREGEKVTLPSVKLEATVTDANGNKRIGITFAELPDSLGMHLSMSVRTAVNYARLVWSSMGMLVSGQVGVDQLAGPVGMAEVMADTAKYSMISFFQLVAFISINLGVMNLLPLPALDGGRLVFLIIEGIRRKPVPPKYEGYVHAAGLMLLLMLMVYVTGQDVLRIFMRSN